MSAVRRICVFCGSRPGTGQRYLDLARHLGNLLARSNIGLVYGGALGGLMGTLAQSTIAAGGEVIGVIPESLVSGETPNLGLTQLHVVDSMHARKALMADLADGFIAIPGGFGTLDELFEIATWSQLGIHSKPVGMLNAFGFYDKLLAFLRHCQEEGFSTASQMHRLLLSETCESLLDKMGVAVNEAAVP